MCVPVDLKSPQAGATGRCEVALSLGTPGAPEGIEPKLASRVVVLEVGIQKNQPEPPLPNQLPASSSQPTRSPPPRPSSLPSAGTATGPEGVVPAGLGDPPRP